MAQNKEKEVKKNMLHIGEAVTFKVKKNQQGDIFIRAKLELHSQVNLEAHIVKDHPLDEENLIIYVKNQILLRFWQQFYDEIHREACGLIDRIAKADSVYDRQKLISDFVTFTELKLHKIKKESPKIVGKG